MNYSWLDIFEVEGYIYNKEKLKLLTSVYRKAVGDEDNNDKNGYHNFGHTFLPPVPDTMGKK